MYFVSDLPYYKETCDFRYASDLVNFIKSNFKDYFCIGVAGYPETHPETKSLKEDLSNLNYKVIDDQIFSPIINYRIIVGIRWSRFHYHPREFYP